MKITLAARRSNEAGFMKPLTEKFALLSRA